jgi:predicted AAA+ superfamily ATPase
MYVYRIYSFLTDIILFLLNYNKLLSNSSNLKFHMYIISLVNCLEATSLFFIIYRIVFVLT